MDAFGTLIFWILSILSQFFRNTFGTLIIKRILLGAHVLSTELPRTENIILPDKQH
jgi:hypothetical protein